VTQENQGLSRRTVIAGAAWSVPVIAAAVALPMAAASGNTVTNDNANYYWAAEAQGAFTTLSAAAGGRKATFSTQIGYQSKGDWVSPPAGATLMVTVEFTRPVTLESGSFNTWVPDPPKDSTATTFTFALTPPNNGAALTFNVVGSEAGELISTATMRLLNGGATTWAPEASGQSAMLVA